MENLNPIGKENAFVNKDIMKLHMDAQERARKILTNVVAEKGVKAFEEMSDEEIDALLAGLKEAEESSHIN